jgi:2-polyprenyl-3-methyl-5-hydroxy-6-metoxy-1,4-benzoquinol methylase
MTGKYGKRNPVTSTDLAKLDVMLSLLNDKSQPNINALMSVVRNITLSNMNIKTLGYELARTLAEALPVVQDTVPRHVGLQSKPSTQVDIESDWVAHWCGQLQTPVVYHRKLWELAYALQAMFENGHLRAGARGLGFGCGVEPLPSYLAAHGVSVTMTDLPPAEAQAAGWSATNQHTANIEMAYHANLCTREAFDSLVSLRYLDMNAIPDDLTDYDFCWSICALEHLGTIEQGLTFIESSLKTLRPGGLGVHTTELNIDAEGPTIDNWQTVLFQRRHFEELALRLRAQGHYVAELDFFLGDKPMDRFIDLPPFHHDLPKDLGDWIGSPRHLKVATDGFACTCFGLVVRKAA